MAISFQDQIKPLFRRRDITAMRNFGGFSLDHHDDVKEHAQAISARLSDGSMPCDAPWPAAQIALFQQWIDEGMAA